MSQAALRLAGAKTDQTEPAALPELKDFDLLHAAFGTGPAPSAPEPFPTLTNEPAPRPARSPLPTLRRGRLRAPPAAATRLLQTLDWVIVALVAELAALWGLGQSLLALTIGEAGAFLAAAGALKFGLWLTEAYRTGPADLRGDHNAGGLAIGALAGILIASVFAPDPRSAAALGALLPMAAIVLAGLHAALALWARAAHRAGAFSETIVVVGATDAAERFVARAKKTGDARVVAVIDDRLARAPQQIAGAPVSGDIEDLLSWDSLPEVDRIVITVTQKAEARVRNIIERLRVTPNRIDLLLDYQAEAVKGERVSHVGHAPLACVSGRPHSLRRAFVKRVQDVVIGGALLALFAPLMLAIAILIRCDSKGPVVYRQRRHGFNNRIITVYKFRSMRHDPGAPLQQVRPDDPRVTRIGKFLRRTSLDELPQLINVLKGEMSLVGPRPHAIGMRAAERDLDHIVAEYAHRHRVKPGITGWAQVNGSRGPIDTPEAVQERVRLDLDYVSRASLFFDLWILLRTAPALLGDRKATR